MFSSRETMQIECQPWVPPKSCHLHFLLHACVRSAPTRPFMSSAQSRQAAQNAGGSGQTPNTIKRWNRQFICPASPQNTWHPCAHAVAMRFLHQVALHIRMRMDLSLRQAGNIGPFSPASWAFCSRGGGNLSPARRGHRAVALCPETGERAR